ncbi:CoA-binding protein [Brevundimonas sp. S30B]|uniref:acetate--CoA ligase family protein n=1 Tax=unclassified Brevundimonas TaxID=2622653 RepID=UPI00107170F6|nr:MULTISPECIES: acetate--CoA ligase family protein [unclassified Brevundimonas]QBX36664.1 CoA-binding protein [Brevundimonas sp. MF30-B]TFW04541.1 CoA-binding protein [Brevundimonas sp. S30B]
MTRTPVDRALRPRSIAVVGVSATPGSAGRNALNNLVAGGYDGDIHLVSRSGVEIDGRTSVSSVADLPEGVDLAILAVPAAAILETVQACAARRVGVGIIFASGFAELGEAGKAAQDALVEAAEAGGMRLIGPNCLGYRNYVRPMYVGFSGGMTPTLPPSQGQAVAVLTQSGGMMAHLTLALTTRHLPLSYGVSTGNEASLGLEDFLADFADDEATRSVIVFAEQIRRPSDFLAAVSACRDKGKAVVLMHPGRSERAQEAAQSHSGAMAGNYAAMRTLVSHAGAVIVETLEELVDVAEILARTGPPSGGVGIVTTSGAFCGIALDYCDTMGLDVPRLAPATLEGLAAILPAYAQPSNPLDLTTQPQREPDLLGRGLQAVLDDPAIGSVVVAITPGGPGQAVKYFDGLQPALSDAKKPVSLAIMGDGSPLAPEFLERVRDARIAFTRSPERALRAQAAAMEFGRNVERARKAGVSGEPTPSVTLSAADPVLPEHRAKQLLADLGVRIPPGGLARTADEAVGVAGRIGYPVALKAQAADLPHKSDVGGVALSIETEADLRTAWDRMTADVGRARPEMVLDGLLVERMGARGLEMILAARRDPDWGVILVIGLGGVWTETMKDFRILPADLAEADIAEEILRLRAATLLTGGRGSTVKDHHAVAAVAARLGRFMLSNPSIGEIEINPLVVHAEGEGVVALDALVFAATGG